LFTVCPKCTLTLVVTTVDLRAGQGYVRCGRCSNVFNALIALREGDPANGTSDTARRRLEETAPKSIDPAPGVGVEMDLEPEAPPIPEAELEPEPEPEPEPVAEEIVLASDEGEGSLEFDAASTDVSDIFISPSDSEQSGSGSYEAVVLEVEPPSHTDTIAADDWSLLDEDAPIADAESVIEESPLAAPERSGAQSDPAWVEQMFAEAEAQAANSSRGAGRRATDVFPEPEPESITSPESIPEEVELAEPDEPPSTPAMARAAPTAPSDAALAPLLGVGNRVRPPWQTVAGVASLALLLVLQILHFNRQSLALSPTMGPLASRIYGWIGVTLTPHWDLTAYSVRQLGADSEGADGTRLRVRVSLQNESTRVQPLPLLRLTLQDRYGNAVATRDLEPRDYLPRRATDLRLLEPDQRIDAEVHVMDPGKSASSFEVDACLRAESGRIGCANEARRRAAG
jgi:predicted Zn finger-like uncharacterized protein